MTEPYINDDLLNILARSLMRLDRLENGLDDGATLALPEVVKERARKLILDLETHGVHVTQFAPVGSRDLDDEG